MKSGILICQSSLDRLHDCIQCKINFGSENRRINDIYTGDKLYRIYINSNTSMTMLSSAPDISNFKTLNVSIKVMFRVTCPGFWNTQDIWLITIYKEWNQMKLISQALYINSRNCERVYALVKTAKHSNRQSFQRRTHLGGLPGQSRC